MREHHTQIIVLVIILELSNFSIKDVENSQKILKTGSPFGTKFWNGIRWSNKCSFEMWKKHLNTHEPESKHSENLRKTLNLDVFVYSFDENNGNYKQIMLVETAKINSKFVIHEYFDFVIGFSIIFQTKKTTNWISTISDWNMTECLFVVSFLVLKCPSEFKYAKKTIWMEPLPNIQMRTFLPIVQFWHVRFQFVRIDW